MKNMTLDLNNQDMHLFPVLLAMARLGLKDHTLLNIQNEALLNLLGSETLFSNTIETLNRLEAQFNSRTRPNNNLRIVKKDI